MPFARFVLPLAFAGLVASPSGLLDAQVPAPADPAFTEAMQQGEAATKIRNWEAALEAFKRANAILDKKSAVALHGVSRAYHGLGAFKSEANACLEALKHVGADERLAATLHNARGAALFSLAQKNTDKVIKEAESEFRAALELSAAPPITSYNLGVALLRQSRDDEGIPMLRTFVDSGLKTPEVDAARRMILNPRRARENYAPDFSLTTLQGEFFSLKELEGKTVLLDFWGQWCPPCRALTPNLVRLYQKYRNDPNFVMIGISSDSRVDEQKWKDYVAANKMEWPQFLDLRREVISRFEIHAYPTGILIGPDGIILHREQGGGPGGVNVIDALIKKALKATND